MDSGLSQSDRELRRLILRASVLPLLLLAGVAAVLVWQLVRQRELAGWVDHSDVVLGQVRRVVELQAEAESALRGWQLTGDAEFRGRLAALTLSLGEALARLEQQVGDNPAQVGRARSLAELSARHAALTGVRGRPGAAAPPVRPADVQERRAVLDLFRAEADAFVQVEEDLRHTRAEVAERHLRAVVVATVGAALAIGLLLIWLARAQLGRVGAMYGRVARDAEARARALAESEERFRLFVEGVRDAAIYLIDPAGRVLSWNAGAERIKGYRPEEITGRDISIFYVPEDVEAGLPRQELAEAAARGQLESESWRVRKDGSRFWAAITLRALRGADGQLVGYAKLVRDTTERKRAEMRRSAQYGVARVLSEATTFEEAIPGLLGAVAPALGYELALAWVPADGALRLAGSWLRESARGEAFLQAVRGVGVATGESMAGEVWAARAPVWVEDLRDRNLRYPRAFLALEAGLHSVLAFPVPVRDEVGCVLQLFSGDPRSKDEDLVQLSGSLGIQMGAFLERQRIEQAEREAERRRAEELERRVEERTVELKAVNRELEAFSYSVSHDLRAPLRAMDGFSQVLLEDYAERLDATGRDYLGRIRAGSQRMSQLIDDLIQLSRVSRSELRREPVDLSALFREVAAEVQAREPGRAVDLVVQEGLAVRGDARLLRAGLVNLVSNAFKFTRKAAAPRVELSAESGPDGRVYRVRDNGAGFDMAYAAKLFQPFQRLHSPAEFEGTGIGLATWQRIVHRHGGRTWAEGQPGEGASFFFTLGAY